jgi:hypothetical protein
MRNPAEIQGRELVRYHSEGGSYRPDLTPYTRIPGFRLKMGSWQNH